MKGKTKKGFEFEIAEESLNDYELFEDMCDLSDNNSTKIVSIAKRLLGDEQYKKLKEFYRDDKGHVPLDEMFSVLMEIIESNQEGKN